MKNDRRARAKRDRNWWPHISPLHGNFITNPGGGKAVDVLHLIELIEKEVKEKKKIQLQREIKIVSF